MAPGCPLLTSPVCLLFLNRGRPREYRRRLLWDLPSFSAALIASESQPEKVTPRPIALAISAYEAAALGEESAGGWSHGLSQHDIPIMAKNI